MGIDLGFFYSGFHLRFLIALIHLKKGGGGDDDDDDKEKEQQHCSQQKT